jgi:hypothetical protein
MKLAEIFLSSATTVFLLAALASFTPAFAGGSDDGPDVHQDDGPSFFGFVRDTSGKAIADAKVTAEIKGRGAVIARTNSTGVYLIPGFGKEISLNNVTISCAKEGYKQTRTLTRTPLNKKPLTKIEIECTMQRLAAK